MKINIILLWEISQFSSNLLKMNIIKNLIQGASNKGIPGYNKGIQISLTMLKMAVTKISHSMRVHLRVWSFKILLSHGEDGC